MWVCTYGTIYGWWLEINLCQALLAVVFTVSPLESLFIAYLIAYMIASLREPYVRDPCLRQPYLREPCLREPCMRELCFRRSRVFHRQLWADGKLWVCGIIGCLRTLSLWKLWCWRWHSQSMFLSTSGIKIIITNTMAITMAIITICPQPNGHTNAHSHWEADIRFCLTIWVGDLLSPWFHWLHLFWNQKLQFSTPRLWGIVRSCYGSRAQYEVRTTILIDVRLSGQHLLPAFHHTSYTTHHLPPAKPSWPYTASLMPPHAWYLQLNTSFDRACRSIHGSI